MNQEKDFIDQIFKDAFGVNFDFAERAINEKIIMEKFDELYDENDEYKWICFRLQFGGIVQAHLCYCSHEKDSVFRKAQEYCACGYKNIFVYETSEDERALIKIHGESKISDLVAEKFKYFVPYKAVDEF